MQPRKPFELLGLLSLPFLAFLLLPLVALFLRVQPEELLANLGKPTVYQAIGLSLTTTTLATGLTLLLGTPLAYYMARRRFRFRALVDTLIDLPTVLPPAVAGVAFRVHARSPGRSVCAELSGGDGRRLQRVKAQVFVREAESRRGPVGDGPRRERAHFVSTGGSNFARTRSPILNWAILVPLDTQKMSTSSWSGRLEDMMGMSLSCMFMTGA